MLTIQNKVLPLYHQTATKRFRQINKTMTTISTKEFIALFDETEFDTTIVVDELVENNVSELTIYEDGTLTTDIGGNYKWSGISYDDIIVSIMDGLTDACLSANSDVEHCVRGLLKYANENATVEDKTTFIEWLYDGSGLTVVSDITSSSSPSDHFDCAENMSWEQFEEIYENI